MIRATLAAVVAAAALAGPIAGPARADDGRLHTVRYNADEVVRLQGRRGYQSMIEFGAHERIENVAVGDSAAWQVTPNKRANMLFVKPMLPDARTNMTVVTDRRTYLFDLVSAPAKAAPMYALRFSNPPAPRPADLPATPATEAPVVRAEAPTAPPLRLHYGWAAKGDAALLPSRTYDDGITTYLSWPTKSDIPAILTPSADGAEAPVNFAARGDVIEIDQVHPVLILRAGDKRATLTRTPPTAVTVEAAPATRIAER